MEVENLAEENKMLSYVLFADLGLYIQTPERTEAEAGIALGQIALDETRYYDAKDKVIQSCKKHFKDMYAELTKTRRFLYCGKFLIEWLD